MERIRLGVLGCGGIAQIAHLPAAGKASNVEVVAVCDVSAAQAEAVAARFQVPQHYTVAAEMYEKAGLDAVVNCTGETLHRETTLEALAYGLPVLLEKPMAPTVADCEAILAAAEEQGLPVQLAFMKRHDPGLRFAHAFWTEQGGAPLLVSSWYLDTRFHAHYAYTLAGPRISTPEQRRVPSGRERWEEAFIGHSVHHADLLLWFGGPVRRVCATGGEVNGQVAVAATLEFARGARGTHQFITAQPADWQEGLMLQASRAVVNVEIPFPYRQLVSRVSAYDATANLYHRLGNQVADWYQQQLERFAQALLEGTPVTPAARDGLEAQRLILALCEAVRRGGWVEVE